MSHSSHKLTPEQRAAAVAEWIAGGESARVVGARYGVSGSAIAKLAVTRANGGQPRRGRPSGPTYRPFREPPPDVWERIAAALEDQARATWAQAYVMTFAFPDGEWSAASGAMLHGICSEAINKLAVDAASGGDADARP